MRIINRKDIAIYLIVSAFIYSIFLNGCGGMGSLDRKLWVDPIAPTLTSEGTTGTGNVTGVCTQKTALKDTVVANVLVTCNSTGAKVLSDYSGKFSLNDIPAGNQIFTFSKTGYTTQTISVYVIRNITTEITSPGQDSVVMVIDPDSKPKFWTLFVYIAGDNSLSGEVDLNLNQMEQLGSTDDVNIVAFVDRPQGNSRLYLVRKDSDTSKVTSPYIDLGKNEDSGDYKVFQRITSQVLQDYPASHYYLDLWNHGSGIDKAKSGYQSKGICYDDTSGNYMEITQTRIAFETINKKFDIIACDACLMQMIEVAYEWREWVDFLVGSEESIPSEGFPYNTTFATCVSNPDITALQFSKDIVTAYQEKYQGTDTTLSAINMSKINNFITPVLNDFADAIQASKQLSKIKSHYLACTRFSDHSLLDIYDFASRIKNDLTITDTIVKNTATAVIESLQEGSDNLIVKNYSNSVNAHGVSIWGPYSAISETSPYRQCLFYTENTIHWPAFINKINSI